MNIRPALAEDTDAIHALVERAYRGDSARAGWTHEADLLGGQRTDLEEITGIIAAPDQALLLAVEGSILLGCIAVSAKADETAYIGMVTVDPPHQAAGLGRALVHAAEEHARTHFHSDRAEMLVIEIRPELVAWYQRRGYRLNGERRPFPITDPRFGIPLRSDLDFVVMEKTLVPR